QGSFERSMAVGKRFAGFLAGQDGIEADNEAADALRSRRALSSGGILRGEPGHQRLLLSLAGPDKLARLLTRLFDENEFLSPHGLRALSAWHREHPYTIDVEGYQATIDYEPAESTTPLFGGNSNWRGPVWFPVNYLVISALQRYHQFFGGDFTVEYPTGSGRQQSLGEVASDLQAGVIPLVTLGADGRRPCMGAAPLLRDDPAWRDNLLFSEYFHGDTGAGLGASHQTGWPALMRAAN